MPRPVLPNGFGAAPCWEAGTPYNFENCCTELAEELRGNPSCWQGGFTFELCCLPEIEELKRRSFALLEQGAYYEASHFLFRLHQHFATEAVDKGTHRLAWVGFEKAAKEVVNDLNRQPHSLSYFEILFKGLGIDCEPGGDMPAKVKRHFPHWQGAPDAYTEWARCCWEGGLFGSKPCNLIFEMMATALGSGRHKTLPQRDAYYTNMSELWAFHHFTPSMFLNEEDPTRRKPLLMAETLDPELTRLLADSGEPSLGIVWAEYVLYRSPKFEWGVYCLTWLLHALKKAGAAGAVDLIELGAGFGSMVRLVAHARAALLRHSPPFDVRSYTIFDLRSVIDLQRWYLNKTAGDRIQQWDWGDMEPGGAGHRVARVLNTSSGGMPAAAKELWKETGGLAPGGGSTPLRVDFVDTDMRDLFCHLYAEAHSEETIRETPGRGRPARVLMAVNSWHEFTMPDFLWYYNAFVASPAWRTGVDWILYISNRAWAGNDVKESLLLKPRPDFHFDVVDEACSEITCYRLLRRGK